MQEDRLKKPCGGRLWGKRTLKLHGSGLECRQRRTTPPLKLLKYAFQASHKLTSCCFQKEVPIRNHGETVHFL